MGPVAGVGPLVTSDWGGTPVLRSPPCAGFVVFTRWSGAFLLPWLGAGSCCWWSLIRLYRLNTGPMLMRLSAPALDGSNSLRSRLQTGCPGPVFLTRLGLDGVEQAATAAPAQVSDLGDHRRHGDTGTGVGVLHLVIHFHELVLWSGFHLRPYLSDSIVLPNKLNVNVLEHFRQFNLFVFSNFFGRGTKKPAQGGLVA